WIEVSRPRTTMLALPPLWPEVTPETGSRTEIDACPAALAVIFPLVPGVSLTLTTPVFELFQSTSSEMSDTLPSLNVAWAVRSMTSSVASSTVVGWTVMRTMSCAAAGWTPAAVRNSASSGAKPPATRRWREVRAARAVHRAAVRGDHRTLSLAGRGAAIECVVAGEEADAQDHGVRVGQIECRLLLEAEADPAVPAGLQAEDAARATGAADDERAILGARDAAQRRTHLLAGREANPDGQPVRRQGGILEQLRVGDLPLPPDVLGDGEVPRCPPRRHVGDLEAGPHARAAGLLQVAEPVAVIVDAVAADVGRLPASRVLGVHQTVTVVVDAVVADLLGPGVDGGVVVVAVRHHALVVGSLGEPV